MELNICFLRSVEMTYWQTNLIFVAFFVIDCKCRRRITSGKFVDLFIFQVDLLPLASISIFGEWETCGTHSDSGILVVIPVDFQAEFRGFGACEMNCLIRQSPVVCSVICSWIWSVYNLHFRSSPNSIPVVLNTQYLWGYSVTDIGKISALPWNSWQGSMRFESNFDACLAVQYTYVWWSWLDSDVNGPT